jgi:hypothetical protein
MVLILNFAWNRRVDGRKPGHRPYKRVIIYSTFGFILTAPSGLWGSSCSKKPGTAWQLIISFERLWDVVWIINLVFSCAHIGGWRNKGYKYTDRENSHPAIATCQCWTKLNVEAELEEDIATCRRWHNRSRHGGYHDSAAAMHVPSLSNQPPWTSISQPTEATFRFQTMHCKQITRELYERSQIGSLGLGTWEPRLLWAHNRSNNLMITNHPLVYRSVLTDQVSLG